MTKIDRRNYYNVRNSAKKVLGEVKKEERLKFMRDIFEIQRTIKHIEKMRELKLV